MFKNTIYLVIILLMCGIIFSVMVSVLGLFLSFYDFKTLMLSEKYNSMVLHQIANPSPIPTLQPTPTASPSATPAYNRYSYPKAVAPTL